MKDFTLQYSTESAAGWFAFGNYNRATGARVACRKAHKKLATVFGAISTSKNAYRILNPDGTVWKTGKPVQGRRGMMIVWESAN